MPSFLSVRMASHGFSQKGNGRTQAISQIPATSYFSIGRATVPATMWVSWSMQKTALSIPLRAIQVIAAAERAILVCCPVHL